MNQKILLLTPPFTQLNTPYPATAYLKGFLNTKNIPSFQADLGIEVILSIFSYKGLNVLFNKIVENEITLSDNSRRIISLRHEYSKTIDLVVSFLQDKNPLLAHVICEGNFLPEASRFDQPDDLEWAFGTMGNHDKAKHLATLYLEDLSDLIVEAIDPHFGFSRYAEQLGRSASTFDELDLTLNQPVSFIDSILFETLQHKIALFQPTVVAISVPFPGNLYCAFKCGQWLKKNFPAIKIILGGGFVNTELRSLSDIRVFNYVDFITLDDGEAPLFNLLEYFEGKRSIQELKRTFSTENNAVVFYDGSSEKDYSQRETGTPDYSDLLLDKYISVIELVNPMHRLWSDGRWNKLTLAHGCYWGRCTFCDTSLDYIKRYEPSTTSLLCDRIEEIIAKTGQHGFHFVDEAAPPALLRSLAIEIIRRKIILIWWTNIRFEKNFSRDLCMLLKESGCIAVSGGLEVASDRILHLINKGVSIAQVARVTDNFTQAGIMVHAYLMYGFPTQTAQETIDSLEVVRQLFMNGLIQSGFWHHFALTAHSPVGLNPHQFDIVRETTEPAPFANNDLTFTDPTGCDHELFSEGLKKSLYNFMHGVGFDFPLGDWFDFKVPGTKIPPKLIHEAITFRELSPISPHSIILWLGNVPEVRYFKKNKKGNVYEMAELVIDNKKKRIVIQVSKETGTWLKEILPTLSVSEPEIKTYAQFEKEFTESNLSDFDLFWSSKSMQELRENGLLVI